MPDGNPFAIPNGKRSTIEDPDALYLIRNQERAYSGPVVRDFVCYGRRRFVVAGDGLSVDSGVALVVRPEVRITLGASERSLVITRETETRLIIQGTREMLDEIEARYRK